MKNAFLLIALLLAACENPTPEQRAADDFWKKSETLILIRCRDANLPALRDTFQTLRREKPDSALAWSARIYINLKIGVCPPVK